MENEFSIQSKVIIITGGNGDIAGHIANIFAKKKAYVYSVDIKFQKNNAKSKYLIQQICDIRITNDFKKIIDSIMTKHHKIDVLINAAGVSYPTKLSIYSEKNWKKTIDINLTAAFSCAQQVLPYMKKQKKGVIINITSINSKLAFPNNPAYVASKGGLSMLGKALARDWGKYGIRVNNLAPGYIETSMTKNSFNNKKLREARTRRTILGRWGKIDDLIGPCIFLASDASNYITGQDIFVDGGWISNGLSE